MSAGGGVLATALSMWMPAVVVAGAWTQPQGGYYAKTALLRLVSTESLDEGGDHVERLGNGELRDLTISTYAEYGLTDRLTLVASAPYKRLEDRRTFAGQGVAIERARRLGDLELRLRWLMRRQPLITSLAFGGKIPLGYPVDDDTRVPPGTGEIDGDIRFLLGHSLYPVPAYVTGEVGYRRRGGIFNDETFFSLEGGYTVDRLLIKGLATAVRTRGSCSGGAQGDLVGDQNLLKLSPGIIYGVSERAEFSVELIGVASGCNTAVGNSLVVGVALKQ